MQTITYDITWGNTWGFGNAPVNKSDKDKWCSTDATGTLMRNGKPVNFYGAGMLSCSTTPETGDDVDKGVARMTALGYNNVRTFIGGSRRWLETNPNSVYGTWDQMAHATWEGITDNTVHKAAWDRFDRLLYKLGENGSTFSFANNTYGEYLIRLGIRQGGRSGTGMFWLCPTARQIFKDVWDYVLTHRNPYRNNERLCDNPNLESIQPFNEEGLKDTLFRSDMPSFGGGLEVRITGVTKAALGVISTVGNHGFLVNDKVVITNTGGMTELNGTWKVNTVPNSRSLTLKNAVTDVPLDTSSFTTWTASGSSSDPATGGWLYKTGSISGQAFAITAFTKAAVGQGTTRYAHGLVVDDVVLIDEVLGMTQINGVFKVNTVPTTTTFTLKDMDNVVINTTTYGTYVSTLEATGGLISDEKTATHWMDQAVDLTTTNGRQWKAELDNTIQTYYASRGWTVPGTGGFPSWADMNNTSIYTTGVGGGRDKFLEFCRDTEIAVWQELIDFFRSYNPNLGVVVTDRAYSGTSALGLINRPNLSYGHHIYQPSWDDTNFSTISSVVYKQRGSMFANNCTYTTGNSYWKNGAAVSYQYSGFSPLYMSRRLSEEGNYGDSRWNYESAIFQAVVGLLNNVSVIQTFSQGQQKQWATCIDSAGVNIHVQRRKPGYELSQMCAAAIFKYRMIDALPYHVTQLSRQDALNWCRNDAGNIQGSVDAGEIHVGTSFLHRYLRKRVYLEVVSGPTVLDSANFPTAILDDNWAAYQATTPANPIVVQTNPDGTMRVGFYGTGIALNNPKRVVGWMNSVPANQTLGVLSTGAHAETNPNWYLILRSNGDHDLFTGPSMLFCHSHDFETDSTGFSLTDDGDGALTQFNLSSFTKANPGVGQTSAPHGMVVDDLVTITGVTGWTGLNLPTWRIASTPAADQFTLKHYSTGAVLSTLGYSGTFTVSGTIRKSNSVSGWGTFANIRLRTPEAVPITLDTGKRPQTVNAVLSNGTLLDMSPSYNSGNGMLSFTTNPLYPLYLISPVSRAIGRRRR